MITEIIEKITAIKLLIKNLCNLFFNLCNHRKEILFLLFIIFLSTNFVGCGYTTGSLLPPHLKKIYVDNFKNSIDITKELSEANPYKTYKPRLELDITKAIIDKFIFDGNLRIAQPQDADMILDGELIAYDKAALRYDENDNVEQYRMSILVKMRLKDIKQNKILWQYDSYAGSHDYYTSGSQAETDDSALNDAIDDLARRIVEQTLEIW